MKLLSRKKGFPMQTRKVVVEIKTIDDEHCSKKCGWHIKDLSKCSLTTSNYLRNLRLDGRFYLRTARCKKGEGK